MVWIGRTFGIQELDVILIGRSFHCKFNVCCRQTCMHIFMYVSRHAWGGPLCFLCLSELCPQTKTLTSSLGVVVFRGGLLHMSPPSKLCSQATYSHLIFRGVGVREVYSIFVICLCLNYVYRQICSSQLIFWGWWWLGIYSIYLLLCLPMNCVHRQIHGHLWCYRLIGPGRGSSGLQGSTLCPPSSQVHIYDAVGLLTLPLRGYWWLRRRVYSSNSLKIELQTGIHIYDAIDLFWLPLRG